MMKRITFLCVLSLGISCLLKAEEPAANMLTTEITSDQLDFDYKDYTAYFDGNVVITDQTFKMTADKMIAEFEGSNDVHQVTAVGNVTLDSGDRHASCDKAQYTRSDGKVVLSGNAVMRQDQNSVNGDKITIWMNDQRVICQPGRLIFSAPKEQRKGVSL